MYQVGDINARLGGPFDSCHFAANNNKYSGSCQSGIVPLSLSQSDIQQEWIDFKVLSELQSKHLQCHGWAMRVYQRPLARCY